MKSYWAYGMNARKEVTLVKCEDKNHAYQTSQMLKNSDAVRVGYSGRKATKKEVVGLMNDFYEAKSISIRN